MHASSQQMTAYRILSRLYCSVYEGVSKQALPQLTSLLAAFALTGLYKTQAMHLSRRNTALHAEAKRLVCVSCRPQYDTTVQFVVNMERLLAEHNGSSCLALRLQHSTGYVSKPLGAACLSLQDLLRHMRPSLTGSQQAPSRDVQVLCNRTLNHLLPSTFADDTYVQCRLSLHLPYDSP